MKLTMVSLPALLVAALPALLPAASRGSVVYPADAAGILRVLEGQAAQAATEATELASTTRFNDSDYLIQAGKLDDLKADLNSMALTVAHLESVRSTADPTEQAAIDRALPPLRQMAAETTAAIQMLNRNNSSFWRPEYVNHIKSLESASLKLAGNLKQVVALDATRIKEQHLEKALSAEAAK